MHQQQPPSDVRFETAPHALGRVDGVRGDAKRVGASPARVEVASEHAVGSARSRRLALVAVENDALSALFAATLVDLGYEVVRARNGRELLWGYLSLGSRGDVEVVVAELRLPDHPVLDVAEAWARGGEAPRILIVGNASIGERRRAAGLGLTLVDAPEAARVLQASLGARHHRVARTASRRRASPERTRLPSATFFTD